MRRLLGVLAGAAALASGCACGGEEGPPALALVIPAAATIDTPAAEARGAWGVRYVRRCSEWSYHGLAVSERHVLSCDGTIHELASGALVDPGGREPMLRPVARAGARTVWEIGGSSDLVVRGADASVSAPIAMPEQIHAAFVRGDTLLGAGAEGLVEVDLAAGTARAVAASEGCAGALAVGISREGRARCVVERGAGAVLRRVVGARELPVPRLDEVRFDDTGERIAGTIDGRLEVVDAEGSQVLSRALGDDVALLDIRGDEALVEADQRVVRVSLVDASAPIEEVLAVDAEEARFAGDDVVITTLTRSVIWMRRGAPGVLPALDPALAQIAPPEGLAVVTPSDDIVTDPGDVAMFARAGEGDYAHVRVARLDRDELAPFAHDDAAWGRAIVARYLDDGSERWAHLFRDGEGRRVLRGHTYIGGCERTHVDIAVIERDDALELWMAYTGERDGIDRILPAAPRGPMPIDDGAPEGYAGDPSIGRIAR